ncbi:hypothetical protein [uncultured Lutibacter sp.]|uniref:hypothetical protein n=1 Tax=uncultured Lutibacter sp. TaxID=437739 RepID=UPI0026060673|nr:hypothetical protein [uncultured Lutibacter sp.]
MAIQDSSQEISKVLTNLDFISKVIEHLIWPITILIIFIVFRKHFSNIMEKLSGIDATSTGISLKFDQQIDNAIEDFLPASEDPLIAKSGIQIDEKIEPEIPKTPYQQILNIRDSINHLIFIKSQENNITTINKSGSNLINELLMVNAITVQKAKLFKTLIDLTAASDKSISQAQVNKVLLLFNNLKK